MKASDLILALQDKINRYGDNDIVIRDTKGEFTHAYPAVMVHHTKGEVFEIASGLKYPHPQFLRSN
jgi:hypothetical protein